MAGAARGVPVIRIFYTFLILLSVAVLFFLPITEGISAFRTDTKIDELPSVTAAGETTDNLTLTHSIYENDTTGLTLLSSDGDDVPVLNSYEASSHSIIVGGLTDNTTRTITITYLISAVTLWSGFDTLLGYTPLIWYILLVCFMPLSLYVVWRSR